MFGSAAAKYLAMKNKRVLMIAPMQSKYHAHNDQSRLYRFQESDVDGFWSIVSKSSISRYNLIGGSFHSPVGYIGISIGNSPWLRGQCNGIQELSPPFDQYGINSSLSSECSIKVFTQSENAGILDPIKLVNRQRHLFEENGGKILNATVDSVVEYKDDGSVYVRTSDGKIIKGFTVLVCSGCMVNTIPIKVNDEALILVPDAILKTQAVVLFEIAEDDVKKLPTQSMIFAGPTKGEVKEDLYDSCYCVPPLKYPDGKFYLKIGHGKELELVIDSKDATKIRAWYDKGGSKDEEIMKTMTYMFNKLFSHVTPLSAHIVNGGITVDTANGIPNISMRSSRIGVCVGCNGYGAKGSDEVGKIAAEMMLKIG